MKPLSILAVIFAIIYLISLATLNILVTLAVGLIGIALILLLSIKLESVSKITSEISKRQIELTLEFGKIRKTIEDSIKQKEASIVGSITPKIANIKTSSSEVNGVSKSSLNNKEFDEALERAEELKALSVEELKALSVEELKALSVEELKALGAEELKALGAEELKALGAEELKALGAEELKTVSETVVLENMQGTKLYKDRFIHEGKSYSISDMKHASVKSGFIHPLLEILFINNEKHVFLVRKASNIFINNTLFNGFKIDYISDDFKVAAGQWASTINTLIAMSSKQGK